MASVLLGFHWHDEGRTEIGADDYESYVLGAADATPKEIDWSSPAFDRAPQSTFGLTDMQFGAKVAFIKTTKAGATFARELRSLSEQE